MVSLKMGRAPTAAAPARKRATGTPALLVLLLIVTCIVFGGLIGLGVGVPLLALLMGVTAMGVLLLSGALNTLRFGGEGVLWAVLGVVLFVTCADLVSPVRVRGLSTLLLMAFAYLAWRGFCYFVVESKLGKLMLVLFAIFFIWGVISAIHPHPHWRAVAYQIGYNLKLPIMFAVGFTVVLSEKAERRFWLVMQGVLIYSLVMVAFQLAAPGVYGALARGASAPSIMNPFLRVIPLLTGPFIHPSVLAFMSAYLLCLFLVRQMSGLGRAGVNYLCMAGSFFLMLVAGERQEAFDGILVCALLLYMSRSVYSLPRLLLAGLAIAGLGGALLFVLGADKLFHLMADFGFLPSTRALTDPRAILYNDAFYLARSYFPFGTGFGTYGGDASRLFDRTIYDMLGYTHRYWWYREDLYLLDTYWPNLMAEAGFIGCAAVFLFALSTACYALREAWTATDPRAKRLWRLALVGQLLALGDSFTSPVYGDPNSVAILFLFFGIAFVYSRKLRDQPAAAADRIAKGAQ